MDEWGIKLTAQPANSPDMNINDLSFFLVLQSGQWDSVEKANHDMAELAEAAMAVYELFEPTSLNCSFLTLQGILEEVINREGDNDYDISHTMGKAALELQGILPEQLEANEEAIELTRIFLDEDLDEEKNME